MDDKSVWQSMCYTVIVDSNIKNHRSHCSLYRSVCFISDLTLENNDVTIPAQAMQGCSDATKYIQLGQIYLLLMIIKNLDIKKKKESGD